MKKLLAFGLLALGSFHACAQWNLTGNANTNRSINFIGTTDDVDLIFKKENARAGLLNNSNTSFGVKALNTDSAGVGNTAIGANSMYYNTEGYYNNAIGYYALNSNTTGYRNIAIGAASLHDNTTGYRNVANGTHALYYTTTGSRNVAIGSFALYNNSIGKHNTAIGDESLYFNGSGNNNTVIGYNSGRGITTGSANTIIGANVIGLPANLNSTIILADGNGNQRLRINDAGKVLIGNMSISTPGSYKLYVADGILTERLKVALANGSQWADHVFADNYKLKPLTEVENYIAKNKHLPGVPSAEKLVKEGGIDVNEMLAKQMEKIEELTLYIIAMKKEIDLLKKENTASKSVATPNKQ